MRDMNLRNFVSLQESTINFISIYGGLRESTINFATDEPMASEASTNSYLSAASLERSMS